MNSHRVAFEDELEVLGKKTQSYLSDWLASGLIGHYVNHTNGAFYPHSFVTASDEPLDVLIDIYRSSKPTLQRKLRKAIMFASADLIPGLNAHRALPLTRRYELFAVSCMLIGAYSCFEAADRIVASTVEYASTWSGVGLLDTVYAVGLKCVADLAIEGERSPEWSGTVKKNLESNLVRMIAAPHFRSNYAPLCIHALVSVDPEAFLKSHRVNLGLHIEKMHQQSPEQRAHAYATVGIIIRRALREFVVAVPTMKVSGPLAPDRWMFVALASENSEFRLSRREPDSDSISLTRAQKFEPQGNSSKLQAQLKNIGFVKFGIGNDLSTSLPKPPVESGAARRSLAAAYIKDATALFGLGIGRSRSPLQ